VVVFVTTSFGDGEGGGDGWRDGADLAELPAATVAAFTLLGESALRVFLEAQLPGGGGGEGREARDG